MFKNLLLVCTVLVAGCGTIQYYGQAAMGQGSIILRSKAIEGIIKDENTSEELKRQLETVQNILGFAHGELVLPDNGSYRRYAELDRDHVVWNVFAAPALSLKTVEWCYPLVGCLTYRGFFSEKAAMKYAANLKKSGLDVFVAGVDAYSTLGIIRDPVLSTFVHYPVDELAGLLFHELSHQRLFVKGDTMFNESFASAVEKAGVRYYLASNVGAQAVQDYVARTKRREALMMEFEVAREKVQGVYLSARNEDAKMLEKRRILEELEHKLARRLSPSGGVTQTRTGTFELNNAVLSAYALYDQYEDAFTQLLADEKGDFAQFFERVEALAHLEPAQRNEEIRKLLISAN